jgi:hypothetical protein
MKNGNINLNLNDLPALFGGFMRKVSAYKVFLFFLLVAALYGFIVFRINTFSNTPPSTSEETAQGTAQPHIDPDTVAKIQSLQDNSVNVQSLFDSARENPFQE